MRLPWKKNKKREPIGLVNPNIVVEKPTWDLERMKHRFEADGFTVKIDKVNTPTGLAITPVPRDPYDIQPAFHIRYEEVKVGYTINLKALKHNVNMIKLQVREVFVDPERVARRYWHRYMVKKRTERLIEDSRLFWSPPRVN